MASRHFDASLGCLIAPALKDLATQLVSGTGLGVRERDIITDAARESLHAVLDSKVSRLLVLELNAARETGRLTSENPQRRWLQFVELSSQRSFWDELASHYPPLLSRIDAILRNRCTAAFRFAQRWAADRPRLRGLYAGDPGRLQELHFGAGDSHGGGFTVAMVTCDGGRVVYKPRSVAIDIALHGFVAKLADDHDSALSIGVPKAVDCRDHGWVEFITHRYAAGHEELLSFYRGIGHWLALMRLLGGSDLHAENVIAQGGTPMVVDCETLFAPKISPPPSGYGAAADRAAALLVNTVLTVGLLPARRSGLGWRGVDLSAVGMLPGEQPMQRQREILRAGSDEAHVGTSIVETPPSQNHPSLQPVLAEYWPEVLSGFDQLTATLQRLDVTGILQSRLQAFEDCRVRLVPRATEAYGEIANMLWHPVSLHNPEVARQRAFELLEKMADNVAVALGEPAVIDGEIDDLLEGDIPCFVAIAGEGRLLGPRSAQWLPPQNLVELARTNWRTADFVLERNVIQSSLVSAFNSDAWMRDRISLLPKQGRGGDLETRRRWQAAQIVHLIVRNAVYDKEDQSVAWIAPVYTVTGWSVRPLQSDLYNGIAGIALLFGAYLRETAAGRADPVDGVDRLLTAALHTLRLAEAKREKLRSEGLRIRPLPPGGYLGLGSQIWTYLALAHWGLDGGDAVERACKLANEIPEAAAVDDINDLVSGTAGAITPLLMLSRKTGNDHYVRMASQLGDLLHERAKHRNGCAFWTYDWWPEGLGGFAHGVTGIGWALTRLARETESDRHGQLAQEAFAFEDALFDEHEQNWLDLRRLEGAKTSALWCHGAVGIGLAHLSLDPTLANASTPQSVHRAAAATERLGMGWNHCACHGDLGAWELLNRAIAVGEAPKELTAHYLLDIILTSLEQHGPTCGIGRDAFAPGLLPGLGGIAYQLLRAHPGSDLPSILIPSEGEI